MRQWLKKRDTSHDRAHMYSDIKRVFSPMYYERKRKRDEMENGEDDADP